jgi:lysozyme
MSRTPPEAVSLIKEFEGLRLEAYQCQAGVWTIGYGRTAGVRKGQTITEAEADEMLAQDLVNFEVEVDRLVTADVPDVQIGALVSLAYNIGLGAFGKSSLLKAVNAGQPVDALWLQWSRYTAPDGTKKESAGLLRRRRAELALWHSAEEADEVPAGAVVSAAPVADRNPISKSWTIRGAVMGLIGTVAGYLETGMGWLTDLAKWAGEASAALGPVAGLAKTASGIIPASGTALVVAGLVIVISRRVQGK